jgi:hypothetical protein
VTGAEVRPDGWWTGPEPAAVEAVVGLAAVVAGSARIVVAAVVAAAVAFVVGSTVGRFVAGWPV